MKVFLKLCIGLIFIFILTGCFGENYDFSPPQLHFLVTATLNQKN